MKKTLFALLALGSLAMGDTLALPAADTAGSQDNTHYGNAQDTLNKIANWDPGYYVGATGGAIQGNWHTPSFKIDGVTYYEGDWTGDAVILAGRTGAQGLVAGFVFGSDIAAGSLVSTLTFSASGNAANTLDGDITIGIGVRDSAGNKIDDIADVANVTFNSIDGEGTVTLTFADPLVWQEGYKVIAAIDGLSGAATTAYAIDGISASVTYAAAPEPTTATLSLLALAGLAARRRRK